MDQDLKVNHEMIPLSEVIYDGIQEQGIELDYILPDYYPDIFRMVKCEAFPEIMSYSVSDNKLNYDLCVSVVIWYCSENSRQLNTLKQKLNYSKTLELGHDMTCSEITLRPKTDYVNCRVVNQKRIDIKGAVTTKIKASAEKQQEMICDAYGLNLQLRKTPVEYSLGKLTAVRAVDISEEVEMNPSKPPAEAVIRTSVSAGEPETKIVSNKLVVKGNADISVLYSCEESGRPSMETMRFTLPYSQIVDMEGLDETYKCCAKAEAVNCDISPSSDKTFKCELTVNILCSALKTAHAELVTDLYSTKYPCDFTVSKVKVSQPPVPINEHVNSKYTIELPDLSIEKVYDAWCSSKNISVKINSDDSSAVVSGMLRYSAMIRNSDGMPVLAEKENAFEYKLSIPYAEKDSVPEADIDIENCTYNLVSGNKLTINADILICGRLCRSSETEAVTSIDVNTAEAKKKDGDYAIKLYFGSDGENVWNIAKKYSTSVKAVMEENDLYDEKLNGNSMLLIPIVN